METFHSVRAGEHESTRAQCSQWENSTDNGSQMNDKLAVHKDSPNTLGDRRPRPVVEEQWEEVEDSLTMINDLLNPFNSVIRYLTRNGYISKKDQTTKNQIDHKIISWIEEFSQNFYYAFIAQAVLKIGKGILNPSTKLLPSLLKLFSKNNLATCALLAVLGAGYKLGVEKLRQLSSHHDKINTFVSIALAAISLLQNKGKMKKNYMYVFLFWKYLETMSKILEKGKVIKKVKKLEVEFYELWILSFSLRFSFRVKVSRRDDSK